jgi:hypothetical protein
MKQGRSRAPTTAMLTGQNAVSRACVWKIPTLLHGVVSVTDTVAMIFPFYNQSMVPTQTEGFASSKGPTTVPDRTNAHDMHVHRMTTRMYRLQESEADAMQQLECDVGESDLQSSHAVWIITSRYGDRASGNRTQRASQEDIPKRAARMQQCERVRQGMEYMPVFRVSENSECYVPSGRRAMFHDNFGNQIKLPSIKFVSRTFNLTRPGSQKLEVSFALVRELS